MIRLGSVEIAKHESRVTESLTRPVCVGSEALTFGACRVIGMTVGASQRQVRDSLAEAIRARWESQVCPVHGPRILVETRICIPLIASASEGGPQSRSAGGMRRTISGSRSLSQKLLSSDRGAPDGRSRAPRARKPHEAPGRFVSRVRGPGRRRRRVGGRQKGVSKIASPSSCSRRKKLWFDD